MSLSNSLFNQTKTEVLAIVDVNLDKDSKQIWEQVKKGLPNVPEYILKSCIEELSKED